MKLRLRPGSGVTGVLWPAVPAVVASVAGVQLWMTNPNSGGASVVIALGTVVLYAALMALHLLGVWKLNYTECTATGIRMRRLFWTWDVAWTQVSSIDAERVSLSARNPWARSKVRAVRVWTTGGRSFLLGAPIDRGFRPDPEFDASVAEIQSCWRIARAGLTGMEPPDALRGAQGARHRPAAPDRRGNGMIRFKWQRISYVTASTPKVTVCASGEPSRSSVITMDTILAMSLIVQVRAGASNAPYREGSVKPG